MKKKLIIGMIFCILIILCGNNVQAYDGEIDPENYITMPGRMNIINGQSTGTISVSATGYEISYQKNDISESTFNSIINKNDEYNNFYETSKTQKKEKETNLTNLQNAYNDLVSSGTATETELKQAKDKCDAAYAEYQTFITTTNSEMEKLEKEVYKLVPTYNSSWTKTTNDSNNVKLNFGNYSGKIYFILWGKIENGTNTYYDFQIYSNEIKNNETEEQPQNGEWTDFSKAKVSVEQRSDVRKYNFTISNVNPMDNHTYYYAIGDGSKTPEFSINLQQLAYDKTKKVLYSSNISEYLELGPDQYLYIYETYLNSETKFVNKLVLNKTKLEKPEQKKYTDAFFATMVTNDTTQILFNTPWGDNTVRKVHLKIGKISDDTILKNIYNKKGNAFEELLKYAKTNKVFYDKVLDSNATGAAGGIELKNTNLFDTSNIVDGGYYFLYAIVEGENGKYVQTEGVTLARASKLASNSFSLFFYGSDDFSWKTFVGEGEGGGNGTSESPKVLPFAGIESVLVLMTVVVMILGLISYKKYTRYKGIK